MEKETNATKKFVDHLFLPADLLLNGQRKMVEGLLSTAERVTGIESVDTSSYFDMVDTYREISKSLASSPTRLFTISSWFLQTQFKLSQQALLKMAGRNVEPTIAPEEGDRRFHHESWEKNPFFNYLKQLYLINAKAVLDLVDNPEDKEVEQHLFFTRQVVNSLSPTNFLITNPEVLKMTLKSGGENLKNGLKNFIEDRKKFPKGFNVSMTDFSAFEVGKNLATTPGKVIFQNEMMQLIQYAPTTATTYKRPLLIIPPWINKYYILDLKPESSLIKWLVDQGFTTFIISWVNPTKEHKDKSWENYLTEGTLVAMDAIEKATGERELNTIGYCIGGTLQATTLAYLAAKKDDRIKSATYFTTLIDFTDPGGIGVFINEKMIQGIEKRIEKSGVYDGRSMSFSFALLRENDLYWSFFINNYLKGEKPTSFDILFWNSDCTNMPGKMHTFYLRNMYLENKLRVPNAITLDGVKIDLSKIKTPIYFLSTIQDHIAKWKATYKGVHLHKGEVTFVLSGSGHIAGVVNPPAAKKYGYWTNPETPNDPDLWLKDATKNDGSWWPHWKEWVKKHADVEVPARVPGGGSLPALEDAPGSYVKKKLK